MPARSRQVPTFTETARRAQIVEYAIETIAELGYREASVRKIADRVGVAMSVVLYHFGSKDELVAAIVTELHRSLLDIMVPAVRAEPTAAGKLAAHIRAHTSYIASHPAHQLALLQIGSNYRGRDGQRLEQLVVDRTELPELAEVELETIFQLGRDTGEFRELSVVSMATAVRGAIGGGLMRLSADPEFDVRAYGEDLVVAFQAASRRA